MSIEIGKISQLYRYPVKSMAGSRLDRASLGWHGIEGDRRFAVRRIEDQGGSPWLTASRLPELLLYKPGYRTESDSTGSGLPKHVRTPAGRDLSLLSEELSQELSEKHGSPVQLMRLKQGIFDEAPVSIINLATILEIEREAGRGLEVLRFRPNIVIETSSAEPFAEDTWVEKSLTFGDGESGPIVSLIMRDLRCVMINLDPNTGAPDHRVMKAAVLLNGNNAGAYGTVIRTGELTIGQKVYLRKAGT